MIPVGAQLTVTLSNNFVFDDAFEVALNGVAVAVQVNKLAYSFTTHYTTGLSRILEAATGTQDFVFEVKKGLRNPSTGPYRYNYFNIQLATADGVYGIDGSLSKQVYIF